MALDRATVAKVATLARIRLEEAELEPMAAELSKILTFVEQLDRVDTTGVEPMTSVVQMDLPQRADVVTDGGYQEKVLANGPRVENGFFAVPKVVE
ncbi:MAG: Asp-tRNA(Asn)/Glu-tRNA(Gln) amidotransferase subunit GatC [Alphaproteobacteria bacterium]